MKKCRRDGLSLQACQTTQFPSVLVTVSLSVHFNGHFPDGCGLAGTGMSFWILLELRMMEVMVTTGAIRGAKLQSNHHHQETNTQFFLQWQCLKTFNLRMTG